MRARSVLTAGLAALLLAAVVLHPDRPPPAHTGGFGEKTCLECHFDGALNEPGGSLAVRGIPAQYQPGRAYALTLTVARADMQRGGFQMAARFAEGPRQGRQAGRFATAGEAVAVDVEQGVEYIRQTAAGSVPPAPDSLCWTFTWHAPDSAAGPVVFHAAANAANGDESPFGDYIYTGEIRSMVNDQ